MSTATICLTWAFLNSVDVVRCYTLGRSGHAVGVDDGVYRIAFFCDAEERCYMSANAMYMVTTALHGMVVLGIAYILSRMGADEYTRILLLAFGLKVIGSYVFAMFFYMSGRRSAMHVLAQVSKRTPVPPKGTDWEDMTIDQKVMVGWAYSPKADWVAYTFPEQVLWLLGDCLLAGLCIGLATMA